MISKKDKKKINDLITAILILKTRGEARNFLRDLLTESELVEFGNRWRAARMLAKKERYADIQFETGLSSTTVARVSKWLNRGKGGYKTMLKKMGLTKKHHNLSFVGKGLR